MQNTSAKGHTSCTTASELCYATPYTSSKRLTLTNLFVNKTPFSDDANAMTSHQYELPSADTTSMAESSTVCVDFSVVDIDTHTAFHTKAARLLHRVLGDNRDITLVDNLRVTLKEKKQKKCKPS